MGRAKQILVVLLVAVLMCLWTGRGQQQKADGQQ